MHTYTTILRPIIQDNLGQQASPVENWGILLEHSFTHVISGVCIAYYEYPQMCWLSTTHTHQLYHASQVLWPLCWVVAFQRSLKPHTSRRIWRSQAWIWLTSSRIQTYIQSLGCIQATRMASSAAVTWTSEPVKSAATASVSTPCLPVDRDHHVKGFDRYPSRYRHWWSICTGVAGSVSGLQHGGPRLSDLSAENFLLSGLVLQWFQLYLTGRRQYVWTGSFLCILYDTDRVRYCSCCTLPIVFHWSRVTVSAHTCTQTIHRFMDPVGHLRHWSVRNRLPPVSNLT